MKIDVLIFHLIAFFTNPMNGGAIGDVGVRRGLG